MDLLTKLNPNQKKAVLHTDGPLLILAGAGSGKTRVITHRIAYLIHTKHINPTRIFAVTFTNKAAEEMKNRIMDLAGPGGNSVFVKTFHSAAVYILRRWGERIGIHPSFSIYDSGDQEDVIKSILIDMRLDPKKLKPSTLASQISEIKDRAELLEGANIDLLLPKYHALDFSELYKEYGKRLREANALDFNDLLIKTVELLRKNPETLSDLQRRWQYFMVDEYQDTNFAQYLIAKFLASGSRNLCVVGDDDQSIYSWRGADIRNILNFEKDYPDAMVVTLEENYRSTRPILDAASSVIRNNQQRKNKKIISQRGDGEAPVYCRTSNEYGEAQYVVNTLISLKHRENYKNRDFAVFYRTNAQSRVFEDMLRRENIPYRLVGGLKFYERREIKDIVAYLRFLSNPADIVSLNRIINLPARGIGHATLEKIHNAAREQGVTVWDAIHSGIIPGKMPAGLKDFRDIIDELTMNLRDVPSGLKLSTFVREVMTASGYKQMLEEDNSDESKNRLENLEEFLNSVFEYEETYPDAGLDQFLQDISLLTSEENPDDPDIDRDNLVTLMTVHNAKGLEFPVVFLTGMEEEMFPHRLASDTEEGIEEERRLCYVGITRAKDRLYLTNAELRRSWGGVTYRETSRFLEEIDPATMEFTTFQSQDGYMRDSARSYDGSGQREPYTTPERSVPVQVPPKKETPSAQQAASSGEMASSHRGSSFAVRERVLHPRYGAGQIVKIEGSGDNVKLTIIFPSGTKTFMEKYTPLEKIH